MNRIPLSFFNKNIGARWDEIKTNKMTLSAMASVCEMKISLLFILQFPSSFGTFKSINKCYNGCKDWTNEQSSK